MHTIMPDVGESDCQSRKDIFRSLELSNPNERR